MKIATWNINSIRLRVAQVCRFLQDEAPDVLALQEIKAQDDQFPAKDFSELGYCHQAVCGQKAYNGVAILSKRPLTRLAGFDVCREGHARHIAVGFENGVELHDFYVPAGGDIPDAAENPKFAHKLDFLGRIKTYFAGRPDRGAKLIAVGDLNIAPLEHDVWSHKQLLDVVSHTPTETHLLEEVRQSFSFTSAVRHFVPDTEKIYSWWSYRASDPLASDRGRLLDHIWVSPALVPALRGQKVLRAVRGWTKASDHVPVLAEVEI